MKLLLSMISGEIVFVIDFSVLDFSVLMLLKNVAFLSSCGYSRELPMLLLIPVI